jgi:hypothetical protein
MARRRRLDRGRRPRSAPRADRGGPSMIRPESFPAGRRRKADCRAH